MPTDSPAACPPKAVARALTRLRELADLSINSDTHGLQAISTEANSLILQHQLEPDVVCWVLLAHRGRTPLLTGTKKVPSSGRRNYTAEELFDRLSDSPGFLIGAMRSFPGKKSAIDLEKLTAAVNAGKFPPPPER